MHAQDKIENIYNIAIPQHFPNSGNPFELFSELEFWYRYRLNKANVLDLINITGLDDDVHWRRGSDHCAKCARTHTFFSPHILFLSFCFKFREDMKVMLVIGRTVPRIFWAGVSGVG